MRPDEEHVDAAARPKDLDAARLLLGLTREALGRRMQLHPDIIRNAMVDCPARRAAPEVAVAARRHLEMSGIIFRRPAIIQHVDGRLAPTPKAVGKLTGRRVQRARNALGYDVLEIASRAGVSTGLVVDIERKLGLSQTRSVYAVVGALQLLGYHFGPNHGDHALVERRRKNLRAWEQDIPLDSMPGLLCLFQFADVEEDA